MRPEDLTALLNSRPFVPLRIHLTDGASYEIRHPEQVMVLRSRAYIGFGKDPVTGVLERVEHCALLHIVRVEELQSVPPNGA